MIKNNFEIFLKVFGHFNSSNMYSITFKVLGSYTFQISDVVQYTRIEINKSYAVDIKEKDL